MHMSFLIIILDGAWNNLKLRKIVFFSESIFVCFFLARMSQRLKVSYCDWFSSVVVVCP